MALTLNGAINMNTYSHQTTPYFYIIRNKLTGIMYAGSKWGKGCHPDTFMTPEGYQTSSPTIQNLINEFGLGIFEILRIDTFCDGLHPYDYETLFLETLDCAGSDYWYNKHNNKAAYFWNIEFEKLMILKYGNKNFNNREKYKNTNMTRYGYEHPSQIPEIKEKKKETCLMNYGVDHPSKSPEILESRKQTCLEKYGVDHQNKREKVCIHCGKIENITHEYQCISNPNRPKYNHTKGKNNPKARKVRLNGTVKEAAKSLNKNAAFLRDYLKGRRKNNFPENVWELYYIV